MMPPGRPTSATGAGPAQVAVAGGMDRQVSPWAASRSGVRSVSPLLLRRCASISAAFTCLPAACLLFLCGALLVCLFPRHGPPAPRPPPRPRCLDLPPLRPRSAPAQRARPARPAPPTAPRGLPAPLLPPRRRPADFLSAARDSAAPPATAVAGAQRESEGARGGGIWRGAWFCGGAGVAAPADAGPTAAPAGAPPARAPPPPIPRHDRGGRDAPSACGSRRPAGAGVAPAGRAGVSAALGRLPDAAAAPALAPLRAACACTSDTRSVR